MAAATDQRDLDAYVERLIEAAPALTDQQRLIVSVSLNPRERVMSA